MGIENMFGPGVVGQIAQQKKKPGVLQQALDMAGTKGGQTLIAAAGAGLDAYGQHQATQQQREDNLAGRQQNANQFKATTLGNQLENDRGLQLDQATRAADASPIGESQMFAQRNALLGQILGNARNFSVTPGDPAIAAKMGQVSGGMRLPEGGLDPAMLQRLYGDASTLESIKNRQQAVGQINPNMAVQDFGSMFGEAGTTATGQVMDANQAMAAQQAEQTARQREQIMRAIDEDIRGEKQQEQKKDGGGNFFGKLLKGVGSVASFIPGVGQIVAPIATGVGGLVNGDGWKSSLGNAALSAVPFGAGKIAKAAGAGTKLAKGANIASAILGRG